MTQPESAFAHGQPHDNALNVFKVFLLLGLTSFGGPVAHIGYFREEFVARRKWLSETAYAELVALCQFAPGPASTKVGIGIGLLRAGLPGAAAAWLGFTAPSAIALVLFAYGLGALGQGGDAGWLHGLKVVAVAVVAHAVWSMARNLCPDAPRFTLAVAAAIIAMLWPSSVGQIAAIGFGALVGTIALADKRDDTPVDFRLAWSKTAGGVSLVLFLLLLVGLPAASALWDYAPLAVFDSFYRSGALVFGGGHVVLPLLQAEVVPPGWVTNDAFLAGYGAAQAIPGPMFTFAAYLGAIMTPEPNGWQGALLCIAAIFLPGFLLTVGALPFWHEVRRYAPFRSALVGINASVVGLLLAAFYHPVWTSAIRTPADFGLGLAAFALLVFWKLPPWLVVIAAALGGWALSLRP